MAKKSDGKWIEKMHLKKGALHKDLGVPMDKDIPTGKLAKAAKKPGKVGARARVAETLENLHRK